MSPSDNLERNRPQLASAFAATLYRIRAGRRVCTVRIGRRPPRPLRGAGRGRPWAIVTAYNPGARQASLQFNRHADRRLHRRLSRLQPQMLLRSIHRDPEGRWPDEAGWWLCPIGREQARRIGRDFGQVAIVAGGPAGRAEILECRPPGRHNATGNHSELTAGACS